MTKKGNFYWGDLTSRQVEVWPIFSQLKQYTSKVLYKLFQAYIVTLDIIQLDNNKLVYVLLNVLFISVWKVAESSIRPKRPL